jgi:hypothetical protein
MRGSGSVRKNIREGGPILEVQMDDNNNDLSTECHIGGNIIESNVTEELPSLPPVESQVTACHAMHGSGSTGNDIREGGAILEVQLDDNNDNLSKKCRLASEAVKTKSGHIY